MDNSYDFRDELEKGLYIKPIQELRARGQKMLYKKIHEVIQGAGFVDMDDIQSVLRHVLNEVQRKQREAQKQTDTWLRSLHADNKSKRMVTVVDEEEELQGNWRGSTTKNRLPRES